MRCWVILLVALCGVAACTADSRATGDLLLRRAITLGNAPNAQAGIMYWGARTRVTDDANRRLIFDLDAKTITFADKRVKTYSVRTFDEVARKYDLRRKLDSAGADAAPLASAAVVLQETGKTDRIAGYDTREYTFAAGRVRGAVWVTDAVRPPATWRDWEGLIAFLEGSFAGGRGITEAVAKLGGYPLRTSLTFGHDAGAWTITTQISEIVSGGRFDDLTKIPDGFQRENDVLIPG